MQLLDAAAIFLLLVAVAGFGMGELALTRADDLEAIYWLAVGLVSIRAAVQVARPGNV